MIIKLNDYNIEAVQSLCGSNNSNLKFLEEYYHTQINYRGDELYILDSINELEKVLYALLKQCEKNKQINQKDILFTIQLASKNEHIDDEKLFNVHIGYTNNGKLITPKTHGQKIYYNALKRNDIVFGIGPAGTGKTYLAVIFAVTALKNNEVKKIILTRPAVEAGESLGFLPGDLKEKIDPYLRPLYDALYDMLGYEKVEKYIEKGIIEIAPLAYMRGRTLDDAYIILDEAQNTTDNQMKMFLTRLGFDSKMIITGDISQIDLRHGIQSGLKTAQRLLQNIKGIQFVYLKPTDVVRHPLVSQIIEKYEIDELDHH